MEYTKKLVYLSNQWYNEGLKKANIHDLSGAIASLKKSLQFNRDNITSRNLLGLIYYGRGEVSEALVEWIISKNIKSHNNIANYYIKKVQESASELELIDQAVKKYNQCLTYCQQGGEDLAAIQLRKVINSHPTFLKAYQLLALLYMQTEQYSKARQLIRKAHRIDTTNEITLYYMHELKQLHKDKAAQLKMEKSQTVSYNLGNETIIHPISSTLKDNATILTILNIVIGLVVGAAVVGLLAVPTMRRKMVSKTNQEIIVYSEQIAALKSELDLQQKELDKYKQDNQTVEDEKENALAVKKSYEAFVVVMQHYYDADYDRETLAEELAGLDTKLLGDAEKALYQEMVDAVIPAQCEELYSAAKESYEVLNYTRAKEKLEKVIKLDETYENGEALYMLMDIYLSKKDEEKSNELYNRLAELFPDTEVLQRATEKMKEKETESTE